MKKERKQRRKENASRPDGLIKLNYMYMKNQLKPFKVRTYRYLYPLYKNIKIELEEKPYPIYSKGLEYLENYKHNEKLYYRAFVLSYILGYEKEYEYFKKNINLQDIQNTLNEKTIIKIAKQKGVIEKLNELKRR